MSNLDAMVDLALVRVAENILKISNAIEAGTMQDLGSVQSLRIVAKAIINATDKGDTDE
jgi:hypothetical protein